MPTEIAGVDNEAAQPALVNKLLWNAVVSCELAVELYSLFEHTACIMYTCC
jgi:hypothetical protein